MPVTKDGRPYIEEGPPMYVESLFSSNKERLVYKRQYKTYVRAFRPTSFSTDPGYKWRYGMGYGLSIEEQENINHNIDYLKSLIK